MAKSIADRLQWAVETLVVNPSDRILEIGCGHGAAVSLICRKLVDGTIIALDRSEKMIQIAAKNNDQYVSSGKASFIAAPLDKAELGQSRFNKIFAVNVNLFWIKAAPELEIVKERLLPQGTVYLFNEPPSADKIEYIAEHTSGNLVNAGFAVQSVVIGNHLQKPAVCVIAIKEAERTL